MPNVLSNKSVLAFINKKAQLNYLIGYKVQYSENYNIPSRNSSIQCSRKNPSDIVKLARNAFETGKTLPISYRKQQLENILKFLEERRTDIEQVLHRDLRKHPQEVNVHELVPLMNDLRHTLIELKNWANPQKPAKRLINTFDNVEIYNDPYGVVLIIGPWNYPVLLCLGPLIGTLAAGNCAVIKPSEMAPATSDFLATELNKYIDEDIVHIYQGGVEETKEILKEKFDYIFFTGSTMVGRIVHQAASKYLTPATLELGGKSPTYLDDSVNMNLAAKRILWGKIINSGQTCIGPDYILCTTTVQERFLKSAAEVLKEFYSDEKYPLNMSKIITEKNFKRCLRFLENGEIAIGGQYNEEERIIFPTILINVKKTDPVMTKEIFGPILPILNVDSCDEAIQYIKNNEKPLALYVFSNRTKIQQRFLRETSSGSVGINDTIMQAFTENLPFGGVGSSGMGCYHGEYCFKTFSHQKSVLKTPLNSLVEIPLKLRYPPYSKRKTDFVRCFIKKRRGIPSRYLKKTGIFFLGFATACLLSYFYILHFK